MSVPPRAGHVPLPSDRNPMGEARPGAGGFKLMHLRRHRAPGWNATPAPPGVEGAGHEEDARLAARADLDAIILGIVERGNRGECDVRVTWGGGDPWHRGSVAGR